MLRQADVSSTPRAATLPPKPGWATLLRRLRRRFGAAAPRLNAYERAIARNEQDVAAWLGKAEVLGELGLAEESREALLRVLAIERDDAEALRARARALRLLDRPEEALSVAARAADADERSAASWLEFAACLYAVAERETASQVRADSYREDALAALARATAGSDDPSVWERAGALLLQAGLAEESLARLERSSQLDPARATAWLLRGIALAALGRDDEAALARQRGQRIARLGVDVEERPESPATAVASLGRPLVTFVWREKRGIALTAVLYVCGLAVWSFNAARRDLGLQAAADLQYLIAGIVPALVIACALALLLGWFKVPAWTRDRLPSRRPRESDAVASLGAVLLGASLVSFSLLGWTGVLERWQVLAWLTYGAFGLGIVLVGLTRRGNALFSMFWYGYGAVGVVVLAALAFQFYSDVLYPQLPQSLGGGKPRCAYLDVDASSVSGSTLGELAPTGGGTATVRTTKLDIVFAQDDLIFVRRPAADRLIALRSNAVRAVVGCE